MASRARAMNERQTIKTKKVGAAPKRESATVGAALSRCGASVSE